MNLKILATTYKHIISLNICLSLQSIPLENRMNEMDKWTLHGAVLYEQVRASEQTQCGYHFALGTWMHIFAIRSRGLILC